MRSHTLLTLGILVCLFRTALTLETTPPAGIAGK